MAQHGRPSSRPEGRERWQAHAATIALYRHRHNISATSPLGGDEAETTTIEISERRAAHNALTRLRLLARPTGADHAARREPTVGGGLHLSLQSRRAMALRAYCSIAPDRRPASVRRIKGTRVRSTIDLRLSGTGTRLATCVPPRRRELMKDLAPSGFDPEAATRST